MGSVLSVPWGLDRIDQIGSIGTVTNGLTSGSYSFPNDGSSVNVYVVDTGIRTSHHQFDGRASVATDTTGGNGLDCQGHGTLVASVVGGKPSSSYPSEIPYGVAQGATLYSVRSAYDPNAGCGGGDLDNDEVIDGLDWVASNASLPAVANVSLKCHDNATTCNDAADGVSAAGVTVVAAAGNSHHDLASDAVAPATADSVITVGASRYDDSMWSSSNFGSRIDIFAPGVSIPGAAIGSDSTYISPPTSGTSVSAPHVAGVAAIYLHDHSSGTASLPWVVKQVIKSNANICAYDVTPCDKITSREGSPDRLLYTGFLSGFPSNPIYNQRFFVWQQYADFKPGGNDEPDEVGLDYWTRAMTDHCSTGVNDNDSCTHDWRVNTSRAFFVATHGSWFDQYWGLVSNIELGKTSNETFVRECYRVYLDRDSPDSQDVAFWVSYMNQWGNPAANATGVWETINSFLISWDYELRFGPHS